MFEMLCKIFVKDYQNKEDKEVRSKIGLLASLFSIGCNIFMVIFKLIVSFLTNSVSIRADGFNNLSDVGSNLATLFGFKLSNKHADADHPYGHGRYEYISGLVVAIFILWMAIEAIKESIKKIIHPQDLYFSYIAVTVLIASICLKLLMASVNNKAGDMIESDSLKAAGQDSLNDVLMTSSALICLLIYKLFNLNLDAYFGLVSGLIVLKSGFEISKDVLDTILGKAPDKDLINDIEQTIKAHEEILGIHDLILHDYGPSQKFMSAHLEVDGSKDIYETHDLIDNIENEIINKYHVLTTIHMDPIDVNDEQTMKMKEIVNDIVKSINSNYSIHDFRMVRGTTHNNLVFDVLIPVGDKSDHENLKRVISAKVKEINNSCNCVMKVEHSFL